MITYGDAKKKKKRTSRDEAQRTPSPIVFVFFPFFLSPSAPLEYNSLSPCACACVRWHSAVLHIPRRLFGHTNKLAKYFSSVLQHSLDFSLPALFFFWFRFIYLTIFVHHHCLARVPLFFFFCCLSLCACECVCAITAFSFFFFLVPLLLTSFHSSLYFSPVPAGNTRAFGLSLFFSLACTNNKENEE